MVINMKKLFVWVIRIFVFAILAVTAINLYTVYSVKNSIGAELEDADCILIFGCGLRADGTPSDMLRDRLITGINAYNEGLANKIIVSGDHGRKDYDEVNVMKSFAVEHGVKSEDIFMDHAGFSTYESLYRAKEIFKAERVICVTQKYHLYRALYVAKRLGIEAVGISADIHTYRGQYVRDARELLARTKDFFTSVIKPKPKYLGEAIPVSGSGDITNDN